jgi:hypothetical protein
MYFLFVGVELRPFDSSASDEIRNRAELRNTVIPWRAARKPARGRDAKDFQPGENENHDGPPKFQCIRTNEF